jgi:hypothetical protein
VFANKEASCGMKHENQFDKTERRGGPQIQLEKSA